MAIIRPFKALRPKPDVAAQVASVPYDVVNTEEARALAGDNPLSFLRVIRSEIEFPQGTNPYGAEIYQRARENFLKLIEDGVFIREERAQMYLYQQQMGTHVQTGLVACSAVDDYDSSVIKLHEKTRQEKENDRSTHTVTIGAHAGPVFLAYRSREDIDRLVEQELAKAPLYDITTPDGVAHRIWGIENYEPFRAALAEVPCTYVADGHHRAKSASRCRAEMQQNNPTHTGMEDYNFFLSVLFPHDQLQILPYNRIIYRSDRSATEILEALKANFEVEESSSKEPEQKGKFGLYLAGRWYMLKVKTEQLTSNDPVEVLDASILQRLALEPIFGIQDPRTDNNIDFIGGIRGVEELERLVDAKTAVCAFSLYPVQIEELFAIADANALMPPKSTWFEPKLRSGLLVHQFEKTEDA